MALPISTKAFSIGQMIEDEDEDDDEDEDERLARGRTVVIVTRRPDDAGMALALFLSARQDAAAATDCFAPNRRPYTSP
jgi:hypothetical protein